MPSSDWYGLSRAYDELAYWPRDAGLAAGRLLAGPAHFTTHGFTLSTPLWPNYDCDPIGSKQCKQTEEASLEVVWKCLIVVNLDKICDKGHIPFFLACWEFIASWITTIWVFTVICFCLKRVRPVLLRAPVKSGGAHLRGGKMRWRTADVICGCCG